MPAYSLSPDALEDLQDIWDFVVFDNVNAANGLEDEFFNAFEKLAPAASDGAHSPRCN
jgi:plasmid stabilization system protein ParE